MGKDFVAVGYSCMDVYDKEEIEYPTGNGVDVAFHLAKENFDTAILTAVGNDKYADIMINKLKDQNIDTSHIHSDIGETAQIHMKLNNGDRVHDVINDGVMSNFHLTQNDIDYIKQFKVLHTDFFGRIYGMLKDFQDAGVKIVFDFSTFTEDKDIELILPYVDVGLFSASQINNQIKEKMISFNKRGVKVVIATAGKFGGIAYDGEKFYRQLPKPVDNIVNTVGAGDSFLAGFLSGYMKNMSIKKSLELASRKSSEVINQFLPY